MDKYWNAGGTRDAIEKFVAEVTNEASPSFVPVEERIAVFDCDGTLWCEKPVQNQIVYILQRLAGMAEKDTSLRTKQPFQAAYEKDLKWFGDVVTKHYDGDDSGLKVLLGGILQAFGSMSVGAFAELATRFFDTEQHPTYKVSYREMAYQPMVELLGYLAANGFTSYIVSGGGRDFMRTVTPQMFSIPPERVIGSAFFRRATSSKATPRTSCAARASGWWMTVLPKRSRSGTTSAGDPSSRLATPTVMRPCSDSPIAARARHCACWWTMTTLPARSHTRQVPRRYWRWPRNATGRSSACRMTGSRSSHSDEVLRPGRMAVAHRQSLERSVAHG